MKKLLFFSIFMVVAGTVKLNPAFAPSVPADFDTGAGLPPAGLSDEEAKKTPAFKKIRLFFPGWRVFRHLPRAEALKNPFARPKKQKKKKRKSLTLFYLSF